MSTRTYAPRDASYRARTTSSRTRPLAAPRVNKYGGKCTLCTVWVDADAGVALQEPATRKWVVQHNPGECKTAPAPTVYAKPALGYYVRNDGAAIKVVESKRDDEEHGGKRHYGLVFTPHGTGHRPTWDFVKGAGISVADMVPMTAEVAGTLGLSHGHCINCCAPLGGTTLTATVSALIGYGETCAGNNGWPYPKGVKAQRAYVFERDEI